VNEILLVAILTLPNTNHVAYEVFGTFANRQECMVAKRRQEQMAHAVKTDYMCVKADKD
jgi:hypothetical protein